MRDQETVLQFGGGKFLRAFTDLFIDDANREGQDVGRVVVIQSTQSPRARWLNEQNGRYHVLIRGLQNGRPIDEERAVGSVSRALTAHNQWPQILEFARSSALRFIVSNTTETGYRIEEDERRDDDPPRSFPAKLLAVLHARYTENGLPLPVLPCELLDDNAIRLRDTVLRLAERWVYAPEFLDWLSTSVHWLSTLVDRITIDPPTDHPLLKKDPLLTVAEPFAFWAIERRPDTPPLFSHPSIQRAEDTRPYALRKIRLLNGAHTALVCRAMPLGMETVREAVENPEIRVWLEDLLHREIIPTLKGCVEEPEKFAEECIERFMNPFLDHRLSTIAGQHDAKVKIRLMPTYKAYTQLFGTPPPRLTEILKPWIDQE